MVPRVPRGSPLSMKSYVQYIARDVRWYIIVKPHVSYDGGLPVGGRWFMWLIYTSCIHILTFMALLIHNWLDGWAPSRANPSMDDL